MWFSRVQGKLFLDESESLHVSASRRGSLITTARRKRHWLDSAMHTRTCWSKLWNVICSHWWLISCDRFLVWHSLAHLGELTWVMIWSIVQNSLRVEVELIDSRSCYELMSLVLIHKVLFLKRTVESVVSVLPQLNDLPWSFWHIHWPQSACWRAHSGCLYPHSLVKGHFLNLAYIKLHYW